MGDAEADRSSVGEFAPTVPESGVARPDPLRREDILRVQAVTASLLAKKVTPRELFRHIVDGAADCLGADEASLMLLEGDELRVVSGRLGPDHATIRLAVTKIGEGVAGWVAKEGQPVLLNEEDDLSRFINLSKKGGRIRSAISVPLQVEGRVVGVLNANRLAGGENFTEQDLAILRLFADTAALAIDQTSLLQTVQTRARALQTLLAVTETFAGDTAPDIALAKLMPSLGETFGPARVMAFLGTKDVHGLEAVASWSPRAGAVDAVALGGVRLTIGHDVTRAFAAGEPTWVRDLAVGPATALRLPARILLVPVGKETAVSRCAIVLGWEDPRFTLPTEDLRVLEGLTRQLELVLSRQDRAAALEILQAEMAQARAHLMESERLAAIGQSMAGVVHDINAPLTAVTAFAQLIQKESTDPKTLERAGHILEGAQRAQRLTRELLTLARPHPPTLEVVDLHRLIQVATDLERPQCSAAGIKLQAELDPDVPTVRVDPHRLGQVFINLLVNARQAMEAAEKGETLTVRTRCRGYTIEIHFVDDGPGVPAAIKPKIFDWFFSTKPPGEGTGLGLAVSREIVLVHGGSMRLEDTPGGGATFVIEIPILGTDEPRP
jgi:signal transduction histidine kinase